VSDSIKFGGVTLDCPHAGELAAFYAEITGGKVTVPGDSWAMVTCPDGSDICFQAAPGYAPPSWPDAVSSMQMHLDFDVSDGQVIDRYGLRWLIGFEGDESD
jgi:Glyoxalase-like domain